MKMKKKVRNTIRIWVNANAEIQSLILDFERREDRIDFAMMFFHFFFSVNDFRVSVIAPVFSYKPYPRMICWFLQFSKVFKF